MNAYVDRSGVRYVSGGGLVDWPHLDSHACRGLDNRVYYMLAPEGQYYNYSGCGNTFNCNHPVVRKFILDALRYWVVEMHVDGFRFDLGSIMTRAHSLWHPSLPGDDEELTPQGAPLAPPAPIHTLHALHASTLGCLNAHCGVPP